MKCPQCSSELKKVNFDIGFGLNVDSMNCEKCGFNVTKENDLKKVVSSLKEKMSKQVKIVQIGNGLGVRFPNNIVESYNLKKGSEILLQPEEKGIRIVV